LGRRLLAAVLHSSNEPDELSQWLCHDDSTINIVLDIIIIIIIICQSMPSENCDLVKLAVDVSLIDVSLLKRW